MNVELSTWSAYDVGERVMMLAKLIALGGGSYGAALFVFGMRAHHVKLAAPKEVG